VARYTTTVPSHRPAADTFAYMADFANVAEWDPSVRRATRLDSGPLGRGSRFEVAVGFLCREVALTYELTEYDASARRAVLRGSNATTVSIDTISVSEDAAVTYDAVLELRGPGRLLDPVLALAFRRLGESAAEGLRSVAPIGDDASDRERRGGRGRGGVADVEDVGR
jgi:hypothetical protein